MKKKTPPFWEFIGYVTLIGLIVGQVTIGYWYLFAQFIYLACNIASFVRSCFLKLPMSNRIKDACFTAITLGLIIIWIIR